MSQPSQSLGDGTTQPLGNTSARLVAVRIKHANKHKQIFRTLVSLSSAALLIRVMGMLNQLVVTSHFGAGERMDAYIIASTIPTILAQLLGNAIQASVVPIYARVSLNGTKEQTFRLFSTLLNLLIVGTVIVTLVMFLFRSQIVLVSAPGSQSNIIELAIDLTPFIFPVFILMVVINYLENILNTEGQFGLPAYAGMLVPFTAAVFVFIGGSSLGIMMLCVGMVVGLCLQLCVFIIRIRRAGLAYRLVLEVRNPEIGLILKAAWPILIGALIGQGSDLIDLIFTSFLPAGSISALSYSLKLTGVFSGVIFTSVGRAVLPYLSRQASVKDMRSFKETLRLYVWIVAGGTIVLSVLAVALAHPLVQILFQRGAFTANDTNRTAITFIGFAVGLTPISLVFIVFQAFSALGKTKALLRVTLFSLVANAIFDYLFSRIWQSEGIALATSATYVCSTLILFFMLRQLIGELHIFTFPPEIVDALRKVGRDLDLFQRKVQGRGTLADSSKPMTVWTMLSSLRIPYSMQRHIIRFGTAIAVFAIGVVGVFLNSLSTLRAAFASIVILALLRYRYVLLIAWALINALNAMPIFRGSNILIGLTVPTLLLMTCMPIKQTFKRLPTLAFLFIYLLWVFASIGISAIGVGQFLTEWTLLINCVAIGVLTINLLTTRRHMMGLIDAILLLSTFVALYGIYGYITKQNGAPDPTNPALFRIGSVFGPIAATLGFFLSAVIPLTLYRVLTLQGFKRIVVSILLLISIVALGLTFTRAAYLSVALSIIIMVFFLPSRKIKISLLIGTLALTVVTVLVATVGDFPIFSRFFNQDITTLNGRTYLWKAVLDHFDPTQLLGNGLDASRVLLTQLKVGIALDGTIGNSPHSLFLGTLYDHGIIGVILLTLVFVALAINLITGMRKATKDHRMQFAMALAIFVSVVVQSFQTNDFFSQAFSIYFWIIMALPFALCWPVPKQPSDTHDEVMKPQMEVLQLVSKEEVKL